jgi:hypothetical protein
MAVFIPDASVSLGWAFADEATEYTEPCWDAWPLAKKLPFHRIGPLKC